MVQSGSDLDFTEEALGAQRDTELGPEQLQGNFPIELEIRGKVYRRHPAHAKLMLERVALLESAAQLQLGNPNWHTAT
jgi:hypothetical protein